MVLVTISAEGTVEYASIDRSSGYQQLDNAALDAARKTRFRPYMRNGQPQRSRAKLPYNFSMQN